MPANRSATPKRIKDANLRYHDAAAAGYDSKWGIDFGPIGQEQVRAKLTKALGRWPESPFGEALEIGSGTGYFSLNLLQLGLIERLVATDISPGMLGELAATAKRLGLEVETETTDAERLPFQNESFDLVFGHAVLHHLPDLPRALAELRRVLRPGGILAFCGEPSRYGDLLAAMPKRGAQVAAPLWRLLLRAPARRADPAERRDGHQLEPEVDVHAFAPGRLDRTLREAGFGRVRIRGEELLANAYGWTVRTLEGTADPERVPDRWRRFAFRSYLALQRVDASLLEPRLPASAFYNLVLSARKPETSRM
ncbi:MAG TPA: class I SAM-dependent methyltransferase [Solirubrobacterales bacterium]|nr:class I SAM-dependent methyltransferase [Solirubrobacterales bacterium]